MIRLFLERPEPQTLFSPGGRIAGFGWAASDDASLSISVSLNGAQVCRARVGLTRAEILAIYGRCPDEPGVGFVFVAEVPAIAAGEAQLGIHAKTATDEHTALIPVIIAASEKVPAAPPRARQAVPKPEPIRALMEEALVSPEGVLRVSGWALSLSDLVSIDILLDGKPLGPAQRGISRKDVSAAHPVYPGGDGCGFLFQRALDDVEPGIHTVSILLKAIGNIRRELRGEVLVVEPVAPRGGQRMLHFYCDEISLSTNGTLFASGWAAHADGIAAIEADIDEVPGGAAKIGLPRPDVGNAHPELTGSHNAGFRVDLKVDAAFSGEVVVVFTVRDGSGRTHTVMQPVAVHEAGEAPEAASAAPAMVDRIKYFLDVPLVRDGKATEPVRGFMSIAGWAVGREGIAGIEVFIDGLSQGNVYYGIRREDLADAFPGWDALLSGFAMLIPPQVIRKGSHDVRLVIRDKQGYEESIAFQIEVEPAAEGPGPWQLRDKIAQAELDQKLAFLHATGVRPEWTLLLPLDADDEDAVAAARTTIASVCRQIYLDWKLQIAIAAGQDADWLHRELSPSLAGYIAHVEIGVVPAATPLAALCNDGAQRPLLAVLAAGDVLGSDALLEMSLGTIEGADFLYSDERRSDPSDGEMRAFFKPDWSPDLLLATNYIGRLWSASAALLARTKLTLADLRERGEYEAVLRLTEQAESIGHVTKVLCQSAVTTAGDALGEAALVRAAARRGIDGTVVAGAVAGTFRVHRRVRTDAMVSIIIPTIATRGLIKTTIDSIRAKTAWHRYEIVCLDNIAPSDDPEKTRWKEWLQENSEQVVEIREKFNWSRFNNIGANAARGDFLLFLNDDIEVLDETWLDGLLEHAERPEVGVVGPQLLYPDGRVQHAGMFLAERVARHAFRFAPRDEPGPFGLARTERNVISVTGACMLMKREVFDRLGGFDEEHPVINNDLDFCLRARRAGLRVLYTPHVTLIHHEMVSRSKLRDVYNSEHFDREWRDLFHLGDPYFNPHLAWDSDDYVPNTEPVRAFQAGHPLIARNRVRRLLAVKVDHIGDFITALPALRRLKETFPQAELHVLVAKASLALARLEPAIDQIHEFNFFYARSEKGRREEAEQELEELRERLAPYRFDIAIDLRRQPDTREILQYSGATWLAGFDREYKMPWLDVTVEWEGDFARAWKRNHVSEALTQLVDALAVATEAERTVISNAPTRDDARATCAAIPAVAEIGPDLFARPLVGVHTGAGAVNKQWPAANFSGLIDLLISRENVNVVVIGGPDESEFAGEVIAGARHGDRVYSLVGRTALGELPSVLRACDLYIGNDSGPKHMAAGLGVPTIGIHSGSVDAGEWGPMGIHTMTIRRDVTCAPCYLARASDCHRGLACLHGIKVGDVYRACQNMLLLSRDSVLAEEARDTREMARRRRGRVAGRKRLPVAGVEPT